MLDLGMAVGRQTRDRDRADLEASEVCRGAFERVRKLEDNRPATANPAIGEMEREPLDQYSKFPIFQSPLAVDYRFALGITANRIFENISDRNALPIALSQVPGGYL